MRKKILYFIHAVLFLTIGSMVCLNFSCGNSTSTSPTSTGGLTPTPTGIPAGFGNYVVPGYSTSGTGASVPMYSVPTSGLWAVGAVVGFTVSVSGVSYANIGVPMVSLSLNNAAVTNASVYVNIPSPTKLTYAGSVSYGGYNFAQYNLSLANGSFSYGTNFPVTFAYQAGSAYSMNVTAGGYTATASLSQAPGGVSFSSNGASVTAAYPGQYDFALVEEYSPKVALTYYPTAATGSIGSPFSFPASAYPASSPATYYAVYDATAWTTSTSGTGGTVVGGFYASDFDLQSVVH